MILLHEDKFYEPIDNGIKIHVIRIEEDCFWKGKEKSIIQMEYLNRKGFLDKTYRYNGSQKIEFKWTVHLKGMVGESNGVMLFIDGINITNEDSIIEQLWRNEGFSDRFDFFTDRHWFKKDFKGQIIHWTDFRYKV